MLYWLLYLKLFHYFPPFRIFRYLTFRTAFASLTALFTALIVGPIIIQRLREFQIGQYIREEGPQAHQKKAGTPTMGGLLIAISIVVPTLLWADLSNPFVWIAVLSTIVFAAIGFADDYLKVVHRRNLGLTARAKLGLQIATSALIAVALIALQYRGMYSTKLLVPFFKQFRPDLVIEKWAANPHLWPLAFLPFAAFATYLELQRMPQIGELTIFCGAMVGSSIGFLWYNAHPAEVFMGDVGSLALGGAIGTVAVMIKQELLLPFIGGIFVIEALSVIIQVGSYKLRKKRVFKMAPIHHHFELLGWSESKVIVRFWIASLVFALFALTTLKLR